MKRLCKSADYCNLLKINIFKAKQAVMKLAHPYIYFLIFWCTLSSSDAQENKKLDSLLKIYKTSKEDSLKADLINDIIQIELYNNPREVKSRIEELIILSKKINYKKGEGNGYKRYGGYFRNRGELDSAKKYFEKSRQINNILNNLKGILDDNVRVALVYIDQNQFDLAYEYLYKNLELYNQRDSLKNNDDFKFIGSTFHTMTNAYTKQGMYNLALKSELKALKLYELTNDELYVADALNSLGDIENQLGNYQLALDYLEEAYKTYEKNNDISFQIVALTNIGNSYYNMKSYQEAIIKFKKGIDLSKKVGYKGSEAKFWSNLGNTYENIDNVKKAIDCQTKSIALYEQLGNPNGVSYPYVNIGNLYRKDKDFAKSKYYLDKVINKAESDGLTKVASLAYDFRSKLFTDMKRYDLALVDYKMYASLKDSMFNSTKSQQIEELRAIHQTEKKEQQIVLQENEIDLLEQKAKISKLQKSLLGGGLLLSLGLVGFGFYGFRQKIKRNRIEKEKVDSELAFKKKELTTHALHLAKKNETLESLKQKAEELKSSKNGQNGYQQLIRTINFDLQDDNNWQNFSKYFQEVHKDFNSSVKNKFPEVTSNELRLMSLLKMNLSSKEIANILNISQEGIKKARYRLRKKLNITTEDSLQDLVLSL